MPYKMKLRKWQVILWGVAVIVVCLFFGFPIAWLVLTALRPASEVFYPWRGKTFTLVNFVEAWKWPALPESFGNTAVVATLATVMSVFMAMTSGYLMARFKGRFSNTWFGFIYVVRTVPYITWAIPLFLMIQKWHMYDTYQGILFAHLAIHVTFFSLIMKGFYQSLPSEPEEAARIDGCSRWGVFWRIAVPMSIPGIVAISIICWLWTWNEFLFALILTGHKTPMATVTIIQFAHELGIRWNLMSAAAIMIVLPSILVTILAQKYIVRGLVIY